MFGTLLTRKGKMIDRFRDGYESREEAQKWVDECNKERSRFRYIGDDGKPIPDQDDDGWKVFEY